MRRIRWLTALLTIALLAILAFAAGVLTEVSFPTYAIVVVMGCVRIQTTPGTTSQLLVA